MALPIDPKIAAMSYLHTTGASRQSAGRRFWINRFACGGARCPASGARGAPEGERKPSHGDSQVHWLAPEASGMIAPWRPARTASIARGAPEEGDESSPLPASRRLSGG